MLRPHQEALRCLLSIGLLLFLNPDVSYNCKLQLQPHQEALRCLLSIGLLLFLNRKTEKPGVPAQPSHFSLRTQSLLRLGFDVRTNGTGRETRSGGVEAKLLFCLLFFWFEDGI